jgi:hypothetical protein
MRTRGESGFEDSNGLNQLLVSCLNSYLREGDGKFRLREAAQAEASEVGSEALARSSSHSLGSGTMIIANG